MSEQPQLGFSFDGVSTPQFDREVEETAELLATSVEEIGSPTQSFLLPEIEEDVNSKQNQPEDEIPWGEYVRMVQLFFNSEQHAEFKELASKLAVLYNSKNVTDTIMEAMRFATNRSKI